MLNSWKKGNIILFIPSSGVSGKLQWQGNWISFMDTMLQFSILGQSTRELYLPTRLQRAIINPKKHKQFVENLAEGEGKFVYLLYIFLEWINLVWMYSSDCHVG